MKVNNQGNTVETKRKKRKPSRASKLLSMNVGDVIRLPRNENKYTSVSAQITGLSNDTGMKWSYRCTQKLILVTRIS